METITITTPTADLRSHGVRPYYGPTPAYYPDTVSTGDIVTVDGAPVIFVGVTPAGCVWVTNDGAKVERQRAALARLWARATRRNPRITVAL